MTLYLACFAVNCLSLLFLLECVMYLRIKCSIIAHFIWKFKEADLNFLTVQEHIWQLQLLFFPATELGDLQLIIEHLSGGEEKEDPLRTKKVFCTSTAMFSLNSKQYQG